MHEKEKFNCYQWKLLSVYAWKWLHDSDGNSALRTEDEAMAALQIIGSWESDVSLLSLDTLEDLVQRPQKCSWHSLNTHLFLTQLNSRVHCSRVSLVRSGLGVCFCGKAGLAETNAYQPVWVNETQERYLWAILLDENPFIFGERNTYLAAYYEENIYFISGLTAEYHFRHQPWVQFSSSQFSAEP